MTIFVSYSFEDADDFANITDAFDAAGLTYWNTEETRAGESLAKQLQDAIDRAQLCVFVATKNSVRSSWCSAELGAFWGARKRVLIYVADRSLPETELPKQFQGHLLQRRIKGLVDDCQQYLRELDAQAAADTRPALALHGLSREDLQRLIEDAISRSSSNALATSSFLELEAHVPASHVEPITEESRRRLQRALDSFLGLFRLSLDESAPQRWPHSFSAHTTTGHWWGYAKSADYEDRYRYYVYRPCLLFQFNTDFRVVAVSLCRYYALNDETGSACGLGDVIAAAGRISLGTLASPEAVEQDRPSGT